MAGGGKLERGGGGSCKGGTLKCPQLRGFNLVSLELLSVGQQLLTLQFQLWQEENKHHHGNRTNPVYTKVEYMSV